MPSFNSKKKMDLQVDLPEEILMDIFSRLPAKSVGKFRCLSKSWLKFLSTQQFIKSHLARRPKQEGLILRSQSLAFCTIETILKDDGDETISKMLAITPGIRGTRFECSCDGLVLLVNNGGGGEGEVFLVNPITLEWVKIPNSPFISSENYGVFTIYGIGYDSVRDDYKVLAVSYHRIEVIELFLDFSVYYMKTGVWKRIVETPARRYTWYPGDSLSGAYVNGAYHWMGIWRMGSFARQVIDAFDLAKEVFYEIPFPGGDRMGYTKIGTVGGYLCVVDPVTHISVGVDVWVMKEYGVADSWTKLITVEGYHFGDLCVPLCFSEERDEVVCLVEGPRLIVYDVTDGTLRDLVVDGMPEVDFYHGGNFVGSLVSPVAPIM